MIGGASATMLVPFYGGPHDGDTFKVTGAPKEVVRRAHRVGAGLVRTAYYLHEGDCECHALVYVFITDSEDLEDE